MLPAGEHIVAIAIATAITPVAAPSFSSTATIPTASALAESITATSRAITAAS
jgi:hypothetical protein